MRRIDVVRAFADCPELLAANNAITGLVSDVCYKVRVRAALWGERRRLDRGAGKDQWGVLATGLTRRT